MTLLNNILLIFYVAGEIVERENNQLADLELEAGHLHNVSFVIEDPVDNDSISTSSDSAFEDDESSDEENEDSAEDSDGEFFSEEVSFNRNYHVNCLDKCFELMQF